MSHLKWNIAYIGIGSNLGQKDKNCLDAITFIQGHPDCEVLRASSLYETEPLKLHSTDNAAWYANSVIKIRTYLNPYKLFQFLQEVEQTMGRPTLREKWSPRVIDLDLLFYNDDLIKTDTLKIPHPEAHKRRFVLEPLVEIEPELIHPIKGTSMQSLLAKLTDNNKVVPLYRFYLSRNAADSLEPLSQDV